MSNENGKDNNTLIVYYLLQWFPVRGSINLPYPGINIILLTYARFLSIAYARSLVYAVDCNYKLSLCSYKNSVLVLFSEWRRLIPKPNGNGKRDSKEGRSLTIRFYFDPLKDAKRHFREAPRSGSKAVPALTGIPLTPNPHSESRMQLSVNLVNNPSLNGSAVEANKGLYKAVPNWTAGKALWAYTLGVLTVLEGFTSHRKGFDATAFQGFYKSKKAYSYHMRLGNIEDLEGGKVRLTVAGWNHFSARVNGNNPSQVIPKGEVENMVAAIRTGKAEGLAKSRDWMEIGASKDAN